jgi:hypothetical protein
MKSPVQSARDLSSESGRKIKHSTLRKQNGRYSKTLLERMMKVQEVILRAMAKKITWWQAAEILEISDCSMPRKVLRGERIRRPVRSTARETESESGGWRKAWGRLESYLSDWTWCIRKLGAKGAP